MKTRLDVYKDAWNYKHDGETILSAAGKGFFGEPAKNEKRSPSDILLVELGMELSMKRDQITEILNRRLYSGDDKLSRLVDSEFERISKDTCIFPGAEEALKADIRSRFENVIEEAIKFCEDPIQDAGIKKKFAKKAIGIWSFLGNMLK